MKKESKLIQLSIVNKDIVSRFLIMQQAYKHDIKGYVERINSDTLLIHAEGDSESLEDFLHWCRSFQLKGNDCVSVESASVRNYSGFDIVSSH